jgi:hypothetical protein
VVLLDFVDNNGWDRELIGRSFRSSCDKSLSFLDIFQGLIIPRQGIFFGFGAGLAPNPNKNAGLIRLIRLIRPKYIQAVVQNWYNSVGNGFDSSPMDRMDA